jgi:prophage maintenance system killer protein
MPLQKDTAAVAAKRTADVAKNATTAAGGEIILFKSKDGAISVTAQLKKETLWLSLEQIARLFGRDKSVVSRHLKNVYASGELERKGTVAKNATVLPDGRTYWVDYYNLDAIISIGYRVNSLRGTEFRIWATGILRNHLLKGYSLNRERLAQLNQTLEIISRSEIPEVAGVAGVIKSYTAGLGLLDNYDRQNLAKPSGAKSKWRLTYDEARAFVNSMKFGETSALFGNEKDESFKGVLGAIYQTFGDADLYPTAQEKAANLLYLVVKGHAFSDGNKRIAAALFVYFLDKNHALLGKNGKPLIDNNTLAAMTLMIALSHPREKEIMCLLVMNFLKDGPV